MCISYLTVHVCAVYVAHGDKLFDLEKDRLQFRYVVIISLMVIYSISLHGRCKYLVSLGTYLVSLDVLEVSVVRM